MPRWEPHPLTSDDWQCDVLVDDDGNNLAMIEDAGYAAYPCAFNAATGNLERGGAYSNRVAAMQWAERVAGTHPTKPDDERGPFYYSAKDVD